MKPVPARKLQQKLAFIIESDAVRQAEIQAALKKMQGWETQLFPDIEKAMQESGRHPMVVFMDVEHFAKASTEAAAYQGIARIRKALPHAELIVFCDSAQEHQAADALKNGASDYIVLNQHQYTRMESELNWMGRVLDQRNEDRKGKKWLVIIAVCLLVVFIGLVIMDMAGLIREGAPDVLIEH